MPTTQTAGPTTRRFTVPCPSCGRWNRIAADRVDNRPKCGSCASSLALDRPIHLDDRTFDRVIAESEVPVLVDFYADWCGPCHMMAPAVDQLAASLHGAAVVAKLDTDAAQQTGMKFHIRGIPTVIVFRDGREVKRQSGVMTLEQLRAMIT